MKQNKIWGVCLISLLIFCNKTQAQENRVDFTFRVKKKVDTIRVANESERSFRDMKAERAREMESERIVEKIIQNPKLITGEFGLLKVADYDPTKFNLEKAKYKYVIFSYTVGKNGKAKDIIIERANDLEIKNVLYKSLTGSDWHPAKNNRNQPCDFFYTKQIFIAPLKSFNHEDLGD